MSGFISALSTAAEAVTGIISLAFGSLGGVTLGDFAFAGFECPDQISFGTRQQMTIHRLPGGERVIDMMGPDPIDITWQGTFIDGFPDLRAQQLDQMAVAGEPLPLTWGQAFYTVIIRDFAADTRYSMVPYRIACTVLRNEAAAQLAADPDLTSSVGDDMTSAVGSAVGSTVSNALATAQTAVAALGTLVPGSTVLASARGYMATAQAVLTVSQGATETALSAITSVTSGDLTNLTTQAGTLAQMLQAGAYLGRAARNLS